MARRRSCRWRGTGACRLHPLLRVGAAAGEAPTHAACMHCCWQEPPFSRHRRMPYASSDAGRCCRRRVLSTCRGHPLWLTGAHKGIVLVGEAMPTGSATLTVEHGLVGSRCQFVGREHTGGKLGEQ